MRHGVSFFVGIVGLASVIGGCSVKVEATLPKRFTATDITKTANADFTNEEISIRNENGEMIIVGDSSATKISATVKAVALADETSAQSDVDAALREVQESLVISESAGKITVTCGQAKSGHGKVGTSTTGCEITVKVPAKGIKLTAFNNNGSLKASGLTAADGAVIDVKSDNGSVDATITGGAKVVSDNGDVDANLTPTKGSTVEVSTDNGDIALFLPSDFAADAVALSAGKGVKVEGFSDLTSSSTSRGTKGAGAASVTAKASSLGELVVKSR